MAGMALVLDLIKRNNHGGCVSAKSVHSCGLLSAAVAASVAAAASRPFSAGGIFRCASESVRAFSGLRVFPVSLFWIVTDSVIVRSERAFRFWSLYC